MAHCLRREERFEHSAQHFAAHPLAGIDDAQRDVATRWERDRLVSRFEAGFCAADSDEATFGKSVSSVDHQVDQHLFDLVRVRVDLRQIRIQIQADLDVFDDQPIQHRHQFLRDAVQTDGPRLEDLASAEGQELTSQRRGARASQLDLVCVLRTLVVFVRCGANEPGVSIDDRQQIVEVVGDASCQLADGLHLLRLPQLLLEEELVRNVLAHADVFGDAPPVVMLGKSRDHDCAVFAAGLGMTMADLIGYGSLSESARHTSKMFRCCRSENERPNTRSPSGFTKRISPSGETLHTKKGAVSMIFCERSCWARNAAWAAAFSVLSWCCATACSTALGRRARRSLSR